MPATPAYRADIQHLADGEPLDAATLGRPDRQLAGNVAYLRHRIDEAAAGERLVAHDAPLDPACVVGTPVAWDREAGRFAPAAGRFEAGPSGVAVPGDEARCVGVVRDKSAATLGDVTLAGRDAIDLSAAADGPLAAGPYYLSPAEPGRLTASRPPLGVPVLTLVDPAAGEVLVQPQPADGSAAAHAHHAVDLSTAAAGTIEAFVDGSGRLRQRVASPDDALPGWLPADHASFGGSAPDGASFGYNVAADPNLAGAFPPQPASAAAIFWDPGDGGPGAALASPGRARADAAGIWWFGDCAGAAPWGLAPGSDPAGCAPAPAARIRYVASVAPFDAAGLAVASLRVRAGDPLALARPGAAGGAAPPSAGALELRVDRAKFAGRDDGLAGSSVYKGYDAASGAFVLGPVVEAVAAGPGLTASGTPRAGHPGSFQGSVTLGLSPAAVAPELAAEIYRLDGAELSYWEGWPAQLFPAGRDSAVAIKYNVPPGVAATAARLRLSLAGSPGGGTLPALTVAYRRLPAAPSPALPPSADDPVAIATAVALPAGRYVDLESDPFPIAAGDRVLVTISRASGAGAVALLHDALVPA